MHERCNLEKYLGQFSTEFNDNNHVYNGTKVLVGNRFNHWIPTSRKGRMIQIFKDGEFTKLLSLNMQSFEMTINQRLHSKGSTH